MKYGFLFTTLLACCYSINAYCTTADAKQLAMTVQWYTEEYPPFNYQQGDKISGIATELLRQLYQQQGLTLPEQNLHLYPWPRAYSYLQNSEDACLFSTTYTEQRLKEFQFIGPISDVRISAMTLSESPLTLTDVTQLSHLRIGVVRDDIGHQLLEKAKVNADSFVFLKTSVEMVKMLMHKRVDVIVYGEDAMKYQFQQANIDPARYKVLFVVHRSPQGYACNRQLPSAFIEAMQQALNSIRAQATVAPDNDDIQ